MNKKFFFYFVKRLKNGGLCFPGVFRGGEDDRLGFEEFSGKMEIFRKSWKFSGKFSKTDFMV